MKRTNITRKPAARTESVKAESVKGKGKPAVPAAVLARKGKEAQKPAPVAKPLGKRANLEMAAGNGDLTAIRPDFSAGTHDSWRKHIAAVDTLIGERDISALESFVSDKAFWAASSTRKAIATWVGRAITALRAKGAKPAKPATAAKRAEAALTEARQAAKAARTAEASAKAATAATAAKAARTAESKAAKAAKAAPAPKGKGKPAKAAKAAPRKAARK